MATDLPAEMTRTAGRNGREVILATQSVPSVPHFELDEIVVLSGVAGATQVSRSDGGDSSHPSWRTTRRAVSGG